VQTANSSFFDGRGERPDDEELLETALPDELELLDEEELLLELDEGGLLDELSEDELKLLELRPDDRLLDGADEPLVPLLAEEPGDPEDPEPLEDEEGMPLPLLLRRHERGPQSCGP
jgi:hypothetical protein